METQRMSVDLTRYMINLSDEEVDLLNEAHFKWTDPENFPDEKVERVKSIMRVAFGLQDETRVVGITLQDAIVLQSDGDDKTFYAFVKKEQTKDDEGERPEWEAMKLGSGLGTIMFYKNSSFRMVLEMLDLARDLTVLDPSH